MKKRSDTRAAAADAVAVRQSDALGAAKNSIEFNAADLAVFGGSTTRAIEYFQESQDHGIETFVVRPIDGASGGHDLATYYKRTGFVGGIAAEALSISHWCDDQNRVVAWQCATARTAAGAAFGELKLALAAKVSFADFTSAAKYKMVKYSCNGDEIASLCGFEHGAALVAHLRSRCGATDATPLLLIGFTVRPGGAAFRRPAEDELCSEDEGEDTADDAA